MKRIVVVEDKKSVRLGVDIPGRVKNESFVKARYLGVTMTQVVTRFLSAWVDGKISLPEEK